MAKCKVTLHTKDSGVREEHHGGAVRDTANGKGRYELVSPLAMKRLALTLERGVEKYSARNWEKGIPLGRFLDAALRHSNQYLEGNRDEDHLSAAFWNLMCAIHTEEMIIRGLLPESLNDLPDYTIPDSTPTGESEYSVFFSGGDGKETAPEPKPPGVSREEQLATIRRIQKEYYDTMARATEGPNIDTEHYPDPGFPRHTETADTGTWVVIAAHNEETTIQAVLESLRAYRVLLIDDGSTDGTYGVAKQCEWKRSAGAPPIRVVKFERNCGQGFALRSAIRHAVMGGAKHIVTFDADGQHRAEDITAMLQPLVQGEADVTLGTRFGLASTAVQVPYLKSELLRLAVTFTRWSTGLNLTDTHNGLRAFTNAAAAKLELRQDRMAHASEILSQIACHKMRYKEVPVTIRYTEYSKSKGQSVWGAFRILRDLALAKLGFN